MVDVQVCVCVGGVGGVAVEVIFIPLAFLFYKFIVWLNLGEMGYVIYL